MEPVADDINLTLVQLVARSILRFDNDGSNIKFNSHQASAGDSQTTSRTTIVGPSGSGKTTIFQLITLLLDIFQSFIDEEEGEDGYKDWKRLFESAVQTGEQQNGQQSGTKDTITASAALFFKTTPAHNNESSIVYGIGVQRRRSSETIEPQLLYLEIDQNNTDYLQQFEAARPVAEEEGDNEPPLTRRWEIKEFIKLILRKVLIVSQDHGLRRQPSKGHKYLCDYSGLLYDTTISRYREIDLSDNAIGGKKIKDGMKSICQVI
jgi:energy-coupling factor transporter ATP-binding protein EcfA2